MAITSRSRQTQDFGECYLQNWREAGLLKPSVIKPLIATLEQSMIIRNMGSLSLADKSSLCTTLQEILGNYPG